jgi:hypothetical protein
MKTFKKADFGIQVLLMVSMTIAYLTRIDYSFIVGCIVVGTWQLLSVIVHVVYGWNWRKGIRRYVFTIISIVTIFLLCLFALIGSFTAHYLLSFAAPVMAFYYCSLCCYEVFHFAKRPLELI